MNAHLAYNAYGKHRVRVSKIKRDANDPSQHQLIEASVNVVLEGDLDEGYTAADNRKIVATDTCKNTVYVLAKDDPMETIESFGVAVAEHFVRQYDHLSRATVSLVENRWTRLLDCAHAFTGNQSAVATASVVATRGQTTRVTAGVDRFVIAKTTASGFANFHQDEFRTLPDTDDRILATSMTATWDYDGNDDRGVDFQSARSAIMDAMLHRFIDHYSISVQQTMMLMGAAAIDACPSVAAITLTMPNKHHIPFNLQPFGRENHNDVFIVTDEPYGYITATVKRSES
jgi:urate oxidase